MDISKMRRCRNFNCDKLHGHYCCADCDLRASCKRPCLNHPSRCGLVNTDPVRPSRRNTRRNNHHEKSQAQ